MNGSWKESYWILCLDSRSNDWEKENSENTCGDGSSSTETEERVKRDRINGQVKSIKNLEPTSVIVEIFYSQCEANYDWLALLYGTVNYYRNSS